MKNLSRFEFSQSKSFVSNLDSKLEKPHFRFLALHARLISRTWPQGQMENRQYNLRRHPGSPSPHEEMSTSTREYSVTNSSVSSRTNTSSSVRSAGYRGGIPTPAPVQRTLYTHEDEFDEDDDDDEAYEDEEGTEDEDDEEDEDFDDLEVEEVDHFGETVRLVGDDVDEDMRWNSSKAGSIVSRWRSSGAFQCASCGTLQSCNRMFFNCMTRSRAPSWIHMA